MAAEIPDIHETQLHSERDAARAELANNAKNLALLHGTESNVWTPTKYVKTSPREKLSRFASGRLTDFFRPRDFMNHVRYRQVPSTIADAYYEDDGRYVRGIISTYATDDSGRRTTDLASLYYSEEVSKVAIGDQENTADIGRVVDLLDDDIDDIDVKTVSGFVIDRLARPINSSERGR